MRKISYIIFYEICHILIMRSPGELRISQTRIWEFVEKIPAYPKPQRLRRQRRPLAKRRWELRALGPGEAPDLGHLREPEVPEEREGHLGQGFLEDEALAALEVQDPELPETPGGR
jgi:hypothetical protein